MASLEERFWAKVDKSSGHRAPHMESDCWLWTAGKTPNGYGQFMIEKVGRRSVIRMAHRVSWQLTHDMLDESLFVCHRCDVRACVRPDHLFEGTASDNMTDARNKGKNKNAEKTHCKRGHPFTEENTYLMANGGRSCRICLRAHISRSEKKKRQIDPDGERKKAHEKYLRFKAIHPDYDRNRKRHAHGAG